MRSVWKVRLKLKPWMHPRACYKCEKRYLLEACDCERYRKHLVKQGLLYHVGRTASALMLALALLAGCNGGDDATPRAGTVVTVSPVPTIYGDCKHAATYCTSVLVLKIRPENIKVLYGRLVTGEYHVEVYALWQGEWKYWRMGYDGRFGCVEYDSPAAEWDVILEEYTPAEYEDAYFGAWR